MSAVQPKVTAVRNWDKNLKVTERADEYHGLPLAGFSVIEAENVEEVVDLVANTLVLGQMVSLRFGRFGTREVKCE
ncbi:hypothetical protein [Alteribacillus sp. HJP-4]|uniref:hypothetical protein n=1 Tax=Alteribacillus sp. HJP-4 TaxID=2775394 RepID=UPI0035CCFF5C